MMTTESKKQLQGQFAVLKYVDADWYQTKEGDENIQQLYISSQTRKQFGILERPNLTPGTVL